MAAPRGDQQRAPSADAIGNPIYWEPSLTFLKYSIALILCCSVIFLAAIFIFVPEPTPAVLRWIVQTFVVAFAVPLVGYAVLSYRNRLAEVRKLGTDLASRTDELKVREADLNRAQAIAHLGSWVYHLATDQMRLSAETCRIFGVPEGTAGTHDSYLARVHPDDRDDVERAWQAAIGGGEPFDHEHRILVGETVRWVREIAELERGADGKALRSVGTTEDVTVRKQAEQARAQLAESETQYHALVEASQDAIVLTHQGVVEYANPAALREIRAALPVALASGYITDELRATAPAAGVSELIYKPATADDFCEAVLRLANAESGDGRSA